MLTTTMRSSFCANLMLARSTDDSSPDPDRASREAQRLHGHRFGLGVLARLVKELVNARESVQAHVCHQLSYTEL